MADSAYAKATKIFFSYAASAPRDKQLFRELSKHLSALRRQHLIDECYDSAISFGQTLAHSARALLNQADIIVFLISPDFLESEQCYEVELPYALEQHLHREKPLVPVLLRPALLDGLPLENYSPLPPNGKPVTTWRNRDSAFTEIAQGIRRIIDELIQRWLDTPAPVRTPQFPLATLPHRRSPFFTDRDDLLMALRAYFTSVQNVQSRVQALCGIGGIGKTLLALEYAYRYQGEYQATLWLNAASRELLNVSLIALSDELGIRLHRDAQESVRFAALKRWLREHDRWLVVLDDLDDFPILDQLIPPDGNGHVLLTTHSQVTGPFAHAVPVGELNVEDAALFLLRRADRVGEQDPFVNASAEDALQAMAIAREFSGYPLALDQAGAYIAETKCSLAAYLKLYHEQQATLLSKRGRLVNVHPDPVTTTLTLTFAKLGQADPGALELLHFCVFLHPEALPNEMFQYGAAAIAGPLQSILGDLAAFDQVLATLLSFSLVQRATDSTTLTMHHIVQAVLKQELPRRQQVELAKQAVRLINAVFPEVSFACWDECQRYVAQAQHCAVLIQEFQLTLKEGPLLLERLGFYYYQRGSYSQAEKILTQARQLLERQRRLDPLVMAQLLNSLGLVSLRLGHFEAAATFHQRALALREREPGPDHTKTADSLHNLAVLYENSGEYQLAEHYYQRVLTVDERMVGPDDPDLAMTLNNLGTVYYLQGRYQEAETTYQRALIIYERSSYNDHPDITYTLNGLGTLYEVQGRYQQAEALYQRAFTMRKQALGEEHSETAHSINKLARIAELQGQYQQAETGYQQALSIVEQVLGPEHPDVALFLNNLALLAVKQEQYQQAEQLYQQALTIYEQALGVDHPTVARVLTNLSQFARKTGNQEQARAYLQQAFAIRQHVLGMAHPDTARSLVNLADLLTEQQAYEEALSLLQQALPILQQALNPDHPEVVQTREKYLALTEGIEGRD